MILQALNRYYESLVEKGNLSKPGWDSAFRVSYGLELDDDGTLIRVVSLKTEQQRGKESVLAPQEMPVPAHTGRSSRISANFLCDNSSYLLGIAEIKKNEKDPEKKAARNRECFRACAELHREILSSVSSPAAKAVLAFFEHWNPEKAEDNPVLTSDQPQWREICSTANLIFFYNGKAVTKDAQICQAWQKHYDFCPDDAKIAQCLVTGKNAPVAILHPLIKGVRGAKSSGAALVSFNGDAFESYGHEQGENAPVSTQAAFGYGAALNYLLSSSNCRTIGDTAVVCWAEHGQAAYQELYTALLWGNAADAGITDNDLHGVLHNLARGNPVEWNNITLMPEEHFYILGLSPNAARLSVRFFLRDTFGRFAKNIQQHYEDIVIVRPAYDKDELLPLWKLLEATVNQKSRNKSASPQMTGNVLQAILMGTPYPATLLDGVALRIRAEREVTRARAAIIKGYYTRLNYPDFPKETLTMELNPQCTNVAYTLGRLFAVYERIQYEANPNISATIRDRFFNSASATPGSIFPVICKLSQSHQKVLARSNKGRTVNLEKKLTELSALVGNEYPARLTLPQQGAFQLGYYHQMQDFYTKKENNQEEN